MVWLLHQAHDYLFEGSLRIGGDWGGEECAAYVPLDVHLTESVTWLLIIVTSLYLLDSSKAMQQLKSGADKLLLLCAITSTQRMLETAVALLLFAMFAMLLVIKIRDKAMINLAQPCHLLLLLQGSALLSQDSFGPTATIFMLPPVTGALGAMALPAVNGLSDIEIINFWVQHVLLGVIPLYLLTRRGFTASRLCTSRLIAIAFTLFALMHFTFYETIGLNFHVNPQFMLCPTFAMREVFKAFHPMLLWPSYRTTVTLIFFGACLRAF